jgi:ribosomal protein S21
MVQVEVTKSGTENVLATIRKFTRRVQGTGLIRSVRNNRYFSRDVSKSVQKKSALKRIKRRDEYRQLVKEGKVIEQPRRGGRPMTPNTSSQQQPRDGAAAPARLGEGTPIAR